MQKSLAIDKNKCIKDCIVNCLVFDEEKFPKYVDGGVKICVAIF